MVKWLLELPRRLFVIIVIGAGILFIVFSDPPRGVCDAQVEAFRERAAFFLQIDEKKKAFKKKSLYEESREECGFGRTSGGCYGLFQGMRTLLREAQSVSPDCMGRLASESSFRKSIWETLELMVKLAWGDEPPLTAALRLGIFDPADQAFFCDLKQVAINTYGEAEWARFVERQLQELKGAEKLTRDDKWARSIMSAPCGLSIN